MEDAGRPIRSEDLRSKAAEASERFESAMASARRASRQADMLRLAMQAQTRQKPPRQVPEGESHVIWARPQPSDGAAQVGPFVTGWPLRRTRKVQQAEAGTGGLEMLRPGQVWAATSKNKTETFEARLDPTRLVEYSEVFVPHVAGTLTLELFSANGTHELRNVGTSQLKRLQEPRQFNGRARLTSTSQATDASGNYIHTVGGIGLFDTEWADAYDMEATLQAPQSGTISSLSVALRPTGTTPSWTLLQSGTEVSLPVSASEGESFRLKMNGVDGRLATSLVRVEIRFQ